MRFMQVCSQEGCPNLVTSGRCEEHARIYTEDIRGRSSEWSWVYATARWRGLRRQVKEEQPWCAIPDCPELAHDVDHIVSMQDGGDAWDRANLQGLCRSHHSSKTRSEWNARQE